MLIFKYTPRLLGVYFLQTYTSKLSIDINEENYTVVLVYLSTKNKLIQMKRNPFKYKKSRSKNREKIGRNTWLSLFLFAQKAGKKSGLRHKDEGEK